MAAGDSHVAFHRPSCLLGRRQEELPSYSWHAERVGVGAVVTVDVDDGVGKSSGLNLSSRAGGEGEPFWSTSGRPRGSRRRRGRSWGRLISQLLSENNFLNGYFVILFRVSEQ